MENLGSIWDEDSWVYLNIFHVVFGMMLSTQEWGLGYGSSSGTGADLINAWMREFISSEVTRNNLEWTPVVLGSVKEGILELLDDHLGALRSEIVVGKLGAHMEPKARGSL